MTLEKRIYKFNASREEVDRFISRFDENSPLTAKWTSENSFCLQRRTTSLFKLEGITSELENAHKLKIFIKTDYRYPILYILPAATIIAGIYLWTTGETERGQLLVFGGFSLTGFIYLISSATIARLKKHFKEEFQLI